jgi:hypothetical protein
MPHLQTPPRAAATPATVSTPSAVTTPPRRDDPYGVDDFNHLYHGRIDGVPDELPVDAVPGVATKRR